MYTIKAWTRKEPFGDGQLLFFVVDNLAAVAISLLPLHSPSVCIIFCHIMHLAL